MKLQAIANIAEICFRKGLTKAILSPGSRCAPLTLAFVRHPQMQTFTISDERSAAFIGLGMAQQLREPVVLICTSGSAAYNYAPAIAEAFYRNISLLVLTADRPPEWTDQWDGQTIRQQEIYGKHVLKSYQMPVSTDHPDSLWHLERIVSEAINLCRNGAMGPVHINIPLREPFYPSTEEPYGFSSDIKVIEETLSSLPSTNHAQFEHFKKQWNEYDRKLIVAGQGNRAKEIEEALNKLSINKRCVIVSDVISNLNCEEKIQYHDSFLSKDDPDVKKALQADLLITYGLSLISKNLKLFLRKYKPKAHWHISPYGEVGDPFQSLTNVVRANPAEFFNEIGSTEKIDPFQTQKESNYYNLWHIENKKSAEFRKSFFETLEFGEFKAIDTILTRLPESSHLHVANSMAVRYVNLLPKSSGDITIFANRGTSGIDGSSSTAVGTALVSAKITTLITGDMAFFYDRNAFWHNYLLKNLRIIVLNNHGGGIFRMIKEPSEQPELEEYFETNQRLNAKNTAADFGFEYFSVNDSQTLNHVLGGFFEEDEHPKLLEVFSESKKNQEIFNQYKKLINNNYGE